MTDCYLHVAVHGRKLVHLPLLPAPPLLDGVIVVVELIVRDGAELRSGPVRPVVWAPWEAWRRPWAGHEHCWMVRGTAHTGGVELACNNIRLNINTGAGLGLPPGEWRGGHMSRLSGPGP